jgi:hypothetical protein
MNTLDNKFSIQNILEQLVKANKRIVILYHPLCREATFRIFSENEFRMPVEKSIFDYTVNGRDITKLFQDSNISFYNPAMIAALIVQIDAIEQFEYHFSADYSFERIL